MPPIHWAADGWDDMFPGVRNVNQQQITQNNSSHQAIKIWNGQSKRSQNYRSKALFFCDEELYTRYRKTYYMQVSFSQMLRIARKGNYAVPAINILNHVTLAAVLEAASRQRSPVIIQTSVATVKSLKPAALASVTRTMIDAAPIPAVLHLDHCQSVEMCNLCCDLGWDSVMFDGSHLTLEENTVQTRQLRLYAQSKGIEVEGEVGIIAGVEDDISHDVSSLAGFGETMQYIEQTAVDAIAPAIGTAHGLYHGTPNINFDLIEQLAAATDCPIVIHGGTGLSDEIFLQLIACGASKINISTALKHAYIGSTREFLENHPGMANPLKLDEYVFEKVVELAESFMILFRSSGKADTQ